MLAPEPFIAPDCEGFWYITGPSSDTQSLRYRPFDGTSNLRYHPPAGATWGIYSGMAELADGRLVGIGRRDGDLHDLTNHRVIVDLPVDTVYGGSVVEADISSDGGIAVLRMGESQLTTSTDPPRIEVYDLVSRTLISSFRVERRQHGMSISRSAKYLALDWDPSPGKLARIDVVTLFGDTVDRVEHPGVGLTAHARMIGDGTVLACFSRIGIVRYDVFGPIQLLAGPTDPRYFGYDPDGCDRISAGP